IQPFQEAALVEQVRFVVQKLLDLALDLVVARISHQAGSRCDGFVGCFSNCRHDCSFGFVQGLGGTGPPWCAKQPTSITVPEIVAASSDKRKATVLARSRPVAGRPATVPGEGRRRKASVSPPKRPTLMPETMPPPPGMATFTRTWSWKWS